jgi:hypothetical protein
MAPIARESLKRMQLIQTAHAEIGCVTDCRWPSAEISRVDSLHIRRVPSAKLSQVAGSALSVAGGRLGIAAA